MNISRVLYAIGVVLLMPVSCPPSFAQTWTPPAALNTNAVTDSGDDFSPQLVNDDNGTWIAVWRSAEPDIGGEDIGTDCDILYATSTDDCATWSSPAALNTNAATDSGHDYNPWLATDGKGAWIVVWYSYEANIGGEDIGTDIDILFSCSTDNGTTWTDPAALNTNAATDTGNDLYVQLTTDRNGNWIAYWTSNDSLGGTIGTDYDNLFSRSSDNGATWSAPAPLNTNAATDSGDDQVPTLSTDRKGCWIAVWQSQNSLGGTIGTDLDILYSRSTNNGLNWTAPAALNTNASTDSGQDRYPEIRSDGKGAWIVAWYSSDSLSGTIGTDNDILYSRSTNDGTTWSPVAALNNNASTDSGSDEVPRLTTDENGVWIAYWRSTDSLGGTIGTDYDILHSLSTDNGTTWTATTALNTNAATDTGDDHWPHLAADGNGEWNAVWQSAEANIGIGIGTDFDILFSNIEICLVSFSTDGTPGATVNGATSITYTLEFGTDCTPVTAVAPLGYTFVGWTGDYIGFENPLTLTSVTGNTAITANFALEGDVAYLAMATGENGAVDPNGVFAVRKDAPISIAATPNESYHFTGWSGTAGTSISNPAQSATTVSISQDATVTASFSNKYTVTFDLDDKGTRTGGGNLTQAVEVGSGAVEPEVTASPGWVFTGWDVAFNYIVDDLTVTAQYDVATFSLTYTASANGLVNGMAQVLQTVEYGLDGAPVTAEPNEGCHFVDWSDTSTDNPRQETSVTGDLAVTANFEINKYRVEFATDGTPGATLTGNVVQTIPYGGNCTPITIIVPVGYRFTGWTGDHVGMDNPLTLTNVDVDMTVVATFEETLATLTMAVSGNGSVDPSTGAHVVHVPCQQALVATPAAGNKFVNWVVSGNAEIDDRFAAIATAEVVENATITALFAPEPSLVQLTVRPSLLGGGTIVPNGVTMVEAGVPVSIHAEANDGYAFAGWTVIGGLATVADPAAAETEITLEGDSLVIAAFTSTTSMVRLTMQCSPDSGGTSSPESGLYPLGSVIPVAAIPAEGRDFVHWTATGQSEVISRWEASTFLILTGNTKLIAIFASDSSAFGLETVASSAGGALETPAQQNTVVDEPVSLAATPRQGHVFVRWQVVNGEAQIASPYATKTTTLLASDARIIAVFEPIAQEPQGRYPALRIRPGNRLGNNAQAIATWFRVSMKKAPLPFESGYDGSEDVTVVIDGTAFDIPKEAMTGRNGKWTYASPHGDIPKVKISIDNRKQLWSFRVTRSLLATVDNSDGIDILLGFGNDLRGFKCRMDETGRWSFNSSKDAAQPLAVAETAMPGFGVHRCSARYSNVKAGKDFFEIRQAALDLGDDEFDPETDVVIVGIGPISVPVASGSFVVTRERRILQQDLTIKVIRTYIYKDEALGLEVVLDFIDGKWSLKLTGTTLNDLVKEIRDGTIPVRLSIGDVEAGLSLDAVYRGDLTYPRKDR